jgi:hypothetical protein
MRRWLSLLALLLLGVGAAQAERVERFGDYEVHYNAFPSAFLKPEVAKAYGLLRSRVRGVLMISVLKNGEPVPARVEVATLNEAGQPKEIALRQVQEADAVYQVGDFRVGDGEVLRFTVQVRPQDSNQPLSFGFKQQFFGD